MFLLITVEEWGSEDDAGSLACGMREFLLLLLFFVLCLGLFPNENFH